MANAQPGVPIESARYLMVGAACAGANNLILIGGVAAELHYTWCIALTVLTVLPASYVVHASWTFRAPISWIGLRRYLLGALSGTMVSSLMIALLCGAVRLPMLVAAPTTTIAMLIYNFVMTRWAVRQKPATM